MMPLRLEQYGTRESLSDIDWRGFLSCGGVVDQTGFEHVLGLWEAIWQYDGLPDSNKPHAELTGGGCSNLFINLGGVLKEDEAEPFKWLLAHELAELFGNESVDAIVGSDTSATDLARCIAHILNVRHVPMTKVEDGQGKRQVWPDQDPLAPGSVIGHVEELISTLGSARRVRDGIFERHDEGTVWFASRLPVVVDRRPDEHCEPSLDESEIAALFRYSKAGIWSPDKCPYCAVGSERLRPRTTSENWARLTGKT